jgi:hypothetical protein
VALADRSESKRDAIRKSSQMQLKSRELEARGRVNLVNVVNPVNLGGA